MERKSFPGIRFIDRRQFLRGVAAGAAALALPGLPDIWAQEGDKKRRPNVVLIFSDDQGYAEMGCQGCKDIPTPNLDSVAKNGVRFTDGYVTAPLCSPSRAGLLTGRYQQRFGHEFNPGPLVSRTSEIGLPLSEKTVADRFRAAGYRTGMVGKWHLGTSDGRHPMKRGFEEFFGFLGGAHTYVPAGGRAKKNQNPIMRGTDAIEESGYLTDAFAREAAAFVDRHKDEPFFLYMATNAVHSPLQATEKYLERFRPALKGKRRTFAGMASALDEAVGAVLARIRDLGLEEDTLVFFIADNGGPTPQTTSSNTPLRGTKGQVYEGGIRVPFLLQWKGRVPAGQVFARPVSSLDVIPTALAAAGIPVAEGEALDGVNLLPYLTGEDRGDPHETLFWRMGAKKAARRGKWKIVSNDGGPFKLYDLEADIAESTDLAAEKADALETLKTAYDEWEKGTVKPQWQRKSRNPLDPDQEPDSEGDADDDEDPLEKAREVVEQFDRDGDGKLSRSEMPAKIRDRFDDLDIDGDGFVSAEEVAWYTEVRAARREGK